jgi:hypothetical protein
VRRTLPYPLLAALTLATTAVAGSSSLPARAMGPEGVVVYKVPNLAPASTTRPGRVVDGVGCQTQAKEKVKYHVHVHVSVYVKGQMMRLPAGIGVTKPPLIEHYSNGSYYDVGLYDCLYWLHTHVADGIIHVEAPAKGSFTLGQFFDIWNQPLSASRLASFPGAVAVFENGKRLSGDPRAAPLLPHGNIQIDVGTPVVAYHVFRFKVTGGCAEGTNSCSTTKG